MPVQILKLQAMVRRSLITKYVAYAFKARVCLFEGTFRKYHTELGLTASANTWLSEAEAAAKTVIDEAGFKVYEGAGTSGSYRKIFTNAAPVADEIMLASIMDLSLSVLHTCELGVYKFNNRNKV